MKQKYGGVTFPFKKDEISKKLERDKAINPTIASAIKCFVLTQPGQRRGNQIGSFATSLKHKLIPSSALSGLQEEFKQELVTQFPGVNFLNVSMKQIKNTEQQTYDLIVEITFSTLYSNIEELRVLV